MKPGAALVVIALAAAHAIGGEVLSLNGTPESPAAGDVFIAPSQPAMTLDGPEIPDLCCSWDGLYRDRKSGRILAVRVVGDEGLDPLERLTDEEIRGLRGVRLEAWSEDIAGQVERLDLSVAALELRFKAESFPGPALPRLPPGATRLLIEGFTQAASLSGLPNLVLLVVGDGPLPADLLAGAKGLRVLSAAGCDLGSAPLPVLPDLRCLVLPGAQGLPSAEPLRGSPHLRILDLSRTGVRDLSPLDGHTALAVLGADGNGITRLPRGPLPNLAEFRAWPALVGREREARFREENPGCDIVFSATDGLRAALRGTARLELHDGPCDYATTDPTEIAAFVAAIEVEEAAYRDIASRDTFGLGVVHGCRGDFDIYATLASGELWSLNVAHGSLYFTRRWGVVPLTPRSFAAIHEWAAPRGSPWSRLHSGIARYPQAIILGHRARVTAAVPVAILGKDARHGGRGILRSGKEIEQLLPDPVARALACFRILGCDEAPWGVIDGSIERVVWERLLPRFPPVDLGRALARLPGDVAATRGAAKFLLLGLHRAVAPEALEAALPVLAMDALSSPRAENRRRAVRGLAEIGSPAAAGALLAFLYVGFDPRPLPEGEEEDGGAWWADPDTDCGRLIGEEVYAALGLARLGVRDALPWIEEHLALAAGEEERALAEAASLLRGR